MISSKRHPINVDLSVTEMFCHRDARVITAQWSWSFLSLKIETNYYTQLIVDECFPVFRSANKEYLCPVSFSVAAMQRQYTVNLLCSLCKHVRESTVWTHSCCGGGKGK